MRLFLEKNGAETPHSKTLREMPEGFPGRNTAPFLFEPLGHPALLCGGADGLVGGADGEGHGEVLAFALFDDGCAIDAGKAFVDGERVQCMEGHRVGAGFDRLGTKLQLEETVELFHVDGHFGHAKSGENIGDDFAAEGEEFVGGEVGQGHGFVWNGHMAHDALGPGIGKPLQGSDKAEVIQNGGAKFVADVTQDGAEIHDHVIPFLALLVPIGGGILLQSRHGKPQCQQSQFLADVVMDPAGESSVLFLLE